MDINNISCLRCYIELYCMYKMVIKVSLWLLILDFLNKIFSLDDVSVLFCFLL